MLPDRVESGGSMGRRISMTTREELLASLGTRYQASSRAEKGTILDEFTEVTGYHRKHAVRLLGRKREPSHRAHVGRRVYDEAVLEALHVVWETTDRICGKRLKAVLPSLVESMERHGHLCLDSEVRERLLAVSPATIDRLLAPARERAGRKKRRQMSASSVRGRVPVRTFSDWGDPIPGFVEGDFVAHCGGSMAGVFVYSFVVTDIATGWTDCLPLVAREQSLVIEALTVFRRQLPVPLRGLDTDNDSAFLNEALIKYCSDSDIEFTRSRAYRKNDQAWVEQKNGAVVRRLVGYGRLEGLAGARALERLYRAARLHVNYFQPSFKLREKVREGAKVKKRYHPAATPCDRLLANENVDEQVKARLRQHRAELDPVELLRTIRIAQEEIAILVGNVDASATPTTLTGFEQFLAKLPVLWKEGEARPTHRKRPRPPRTWRTRLDPLASVWPEVLSCLEVEPDITAKKLLCRLMASHPDEIGHGQLRTLQRRVKEWRHRMARALVYACCEPNVSSGGQDDRARLPVMDGDGPRTT